MNRREFIVGAVACAAAVLWIGASFAGAGETGDCSNGWQCECLTNNWINADLSCGGWVESTGLKVLVGGTEIYCVTETISGKHRVHAFDMRKFRGGKVCLAVSAGGAFERARLGPVTVTDQPAADAWIHSVPIAECVPVSVTRKRTPDARFIRVPIYRDGMPVTCVLSDGGRAVYDVRVRLATDGKGDLVASYPIDGFTSDSVTLATGWLGMFCEAHVKAMKDCGIDFVFGVGADRRETNKGQAMCHLSRLSGFRRAGTFHRL